MHLRMGILTVSDSVAAGRTEDRGGPAIQARLQPEWEVVHQTVVPDEITVIQETLRRWTDVDRLDVIWTTGGTGLGPRDVTPEATLAIADRLVPGIAEHLRQRGLEQTESAMLSRGATCLRGKTLIVNLAGSPRAAEQGVDVVSPILEHAIATIGGARH